MQRLLSQAMSTQRRLKVVLCWHMHQPWYRESLDGAYVLPWTYLHAIKDYVDMAAHLEETPGGRAVINFTPTLLEQIADYDHQLRNFHRSGAPIHDPLLNVLACPALPQSPVQRLPLIKACLRANRKRLIERFEPFKRLAAIAESCLEENVTLGYLSEQFVADLVVWYHLAWLGETVRRGHASIARLIRKGAGFTLEDRQQLLGVITDLMAGLIKRYKALAEEGKVELSVTPWGHPILPLLIGFDSAHEATPKLQLPASRAYPGGEERARWHLREGLSCFERHFGMRPRGCWPSEGAVSTRTLQLLGEEGFAWCASGAGVLRNTLLRSGTLPGKPPFTHRAYRPAASGPACFFRDDALSDLIGFSYADWHADDAVANLVNHLLNIRNECEDHPEAVVSIILDGENAWEHYPENGYYFLSALYRELSSHRDLELATFAECLGGSSPAPKSLPGVIAGSWVYGNLTTWIGDPDKNRAWDLLVDAKQAFDRVLSEGRLSDQQRDAAEKQLAICEASDWFWWFGGNNPAGTVREFDHLYRLQLSALYQQLGLQPPAELGRVVSRGGGTPELGGTMRRGQDTP